MSEKKNITPEQARRDYLNELVSFQLFKDGDKYKDDVYVCVNGERILIKRGEEVKIPRKFALVLEQSKAQDAATAAMIQDQAAQFVEEAQVHNA